MNRFRTLPRYLLSLLLILAAVAAANQGSGPTMDIYDACRAGDLEQLNLNLANGADPSKPNDRGRTPLDWVIGSGADRPEFVKTLVAAGANVNAPSLLGPPLIMAADRGQLETVKILLANGATPDLADKDGQTALQAAARKGDLEIVQLLVEKGANVNAADKGGQTPLTLARRDPEIAAYLRQHGAQEPVNTYDRYGPYGPETMARESTESSRSVAYMSNSADPGVLADPNAIRQRLAAFPDLQQALTAFDANAAPEERSWAARRADTRLTLVGMVAKQFDAELTFLKGVATAEKAQATATAIDELQATRKERYDLIASDLREERRLALQETRQTMTRTRGRSASRGRTARGMSADAYGDSGMIGDPYGAAPAGPTSRTMRPGARGSATMAGPYGAPQPAAPGAEQVAEEPLDPETQNQINAWLSADPLDKRSLLTTLHDADLAELAALRQIAMEEKIAQPQSALKAIVSAFTQPTAAQDQTPAEVGAKKTTAAIEGLMLARQDRLDRIMARMAADDERTQRMAERYGTTQTQMSTRGRRGRGRMVPQTDQQPVPRRGRR